MVQVIRRALRVLEIVGRDPERPIGLSEVAAEAGLNVATCARILKTLADAGYVEQVAPRKGYRLGVMPYMLTSRGPFCRHLVYAAEPVLARLAADTGETALLAVLRQGKRIVVAQVEGRQTVQVRGDHLQVSDPYQTATGRLLLAHLEPRDLEEVVAALGLPGDAWPGVRTVEALVGELKRLRGEDVVMRADGGEVVGLAAPVRQRGEVVAAVGLYLPQHRFAGEHREKVLAGIRAAAEAVGARLSGMEE